MIPAVGYILPNTKGEALAKKYLNNRKELRDEVIIRFENLHKFFGYFPGPSIVVGILRLDHTKTKIRTYTKEDLPNKKWHHLRAIFEIFCIGILYLILDLVMTAFYARSIGPKLRHNHSF